MLFAIVIVFCGSSIVLQIFLADTLSTILLAFYLRVTPMVGFLNNTIEVVNESFVLIVFWLLFLFTDYIEDPEQRYKYGYDFIFAVAIVIGLNLLAFLYSVVDKIYTALRNWLAKRKIQTKIKNIRETQQERMRN